MLTTLAIRMVRRTAVRRLRRLGGTSTVAWALKVPLVTFVAAAALAAALRDPA